MPDLRYSNVYNAPLGVAVNSPQGWWDFKNTGWTDTRTDVNILPCSPDKAEPEMWVAVIPGSLLVPGLIVVDYFRTNPTTWKIFSTLNTPENYLTAGPQRGSLTSMTFGFASP